MATPEALQKLILRDQRRAVHAYEAVGKVPKAQQKDYEIAIKDLGANILRCGLCAAIAAVQRIGNRGESLLDQREAPQGRGAHR